MRIIKRDKTYQEIKIEKIQRSILMAFQGGREKPDVMPLVHRVMDRVRGLDVVTVEAVSDCIEEILAAAGHVDVARRFMEYRLRRTAAREARLVPDQNAIAEYIHVAKYARWVDGRRELFAETVARDEGMHIKRWPELEEGIKDAFAPVYRKKGMPSMRSMQFGGAAIEKNNERIYNCSFGHLSRWRAFQEMFYLLLCGCGVGYSVQWRHIEQLSELGRIDRSDVCHYTIADTIEGWADALGYLLETYYGERNCYVEFNFSKIRDKGTVLRTSGGRAPGHLPLKKCLDAVRVILAGAEGRKLRPIEAHDIMCHTAEAVLAGGIRRSSLISLFSPEDTEMLYAKARGNFEPNRINSQREMANNSACLLRSNCEYAVFARLIRVAQEGYGDPGFYFTNNLDYGPNPCGEIGMWPMIMTCMDHGYGSPVQKCCARGIVRSGISFCNLTEVNCAAMGSADELYATVRAMAFIGTLQAAYTQFDYLEDVSRAIVEREALIGVGLTGIMDNRELVVNATVLECAAAVVVAENKRVAALIGINQAARATCIKPSGTGSKEVGGVGEGIHPRWARRYICRITANPLERQAQYFREQNPHMIEVKPNGDWSLCFPVQCADDAITVKELGAMAFLDDVFTVYDHWICGGTALGESAPGLTHNVSCTVTVKDSELSEVIERVWIERQRVAAMTFIPYLLDKKFAFAPRQVVSEERWNHLIKLYKPVDWSLFIEDMDNTTLSGEAACAGPKGCSI